MIKKVCAILILTVSFALSAADGKSPMVPGAVTKDVDGDTLWVQADRKEMKTKASDTLKIRMINIDAPEEHLPTPNHGVVGQGKFGQKATAQLKALVPIGTEVEVEDHGLDKYGRTLGRVYKKSADVNMAMLSSGWAVPYIICEGPKCNEDYFEEEPVEEYVEACEKAKTKGLGVFDPKDPLKEMPFEFRLRMQGRKPDKYVGDFETKELYQPDEYKQVPVCNRIFFIRLIDAKKAGYTPTF